MDMRDRHMPIWVDEIGCQGDCIATVLTAIYADEDVLEHCLLPPFGIGCSLHIPKEGARTSG